MPGGARRAEIGKGNRQEGERIQRRHQPVVQFGAELAGLLDVERIFRIGEQQLPQIALADRIFHRLRTAGELREIEGVAVERHHLRIALLELVTLHDAGLQNQVGAVVVVQQIAELGQHRDALVRIALVVEEDAK